LASTVWADNVAFKKNDCGVDVCRRIRFNARDGQVRRLEQYEKNIAYCRQFCLEMLYELLTMKATKEQTLTKYVIHPKFEAFLVKQCNALVKSPMEKVGKRGGKGLKTPLANVMETFSHEEQQEEDANDGTASEANKSGGLKNGDKEDDDESETESENSENDDITVPEMLLLFSLTTKLLHCDPPKLQM
jgi:hypothetical protein